MKNLTKLLVFMLLISSSLFAQTGRGKITTAEYYWDTDPGQGLGTAMTLQGNLTDGVRSAVKSSAISLTAGLHTFNIRMQDSLGHWGPVFKTAMSVENAITARNISASFARVYWDSNIAGATSLIIYNGNAANAINTFIQSSSLATFNSAGLHTLSVQVMDNTGQYSPPFTTSITVENILTARTLAATFARVYWDGNSASATGLIFLNGNATSAINAFIQSSPLATFATAGLHTLSVEVMDVTGHYSPAFTTAITVEAQLTGNRSIKVTDGRVWFDTNVPALPNMIAFDGAFNDAFETAIKSLTVPATGLHTINVQVRDSANGWGPVFTTALSVEGPIAYRNIKVTAGQLYWDNDTTQNTTTLLAFDGAFDNAIEAVYQNNILLLPVGLHNLSVRVKDVAGNWGKSFTTAITIEDSIHARDLKVLQGEVSIDQSPPLTVIAMNGNFSSALEQAQATLLSVGVPTGLHKLNVRMKGKDNNWGPYFTTAILVSPCASTPTPVVTTQRPLSFCFGDSTILVATPGFNSYQWVTNNSVVSTASSITVKTSGSYIVIATDATNCPGASAATVVDMHHPSVSITSNNTFCQGTIDSLSATAGFNSYHWSGGATTAKIGVNAGGSYTVTVSDLLGCTATASTMLNMLTQPATPVITGNGPFSFCPGSNVTLSTAATGSLLWSTGQTTSSIFTDTSGTYQLIVTGANGCTNTSSVTTLKFPAAQVSVGANGPTTFCANTNVVLTASISANYNWSNGSTSQNNSINTSGNYFVTITDVNGCTATSTTIPVTVNPLPAIPTIIASGALSFCNGGAVTLTSSAANSYLWNNGATTASQFVTVSGTFVDTVFTQFGCKAWSSPTIVDVHPVATISANGPLTFCADANVTLTAHPNSGVSYLWFNGSTSQSVTVNTQTDSAWVIVTEIAGGCSDTASVTVHVNPLPVGLITANGPTTFCSGSSVTFTTSGDPHTKYWWYENGQPLMYAVWNPYSQSYNYYHVEGYTFTASSSGSYSALDIDTLTGCTLMTNAINVIVNSAIQPVISANGGTTLCIGANTTLSSTSAVSYLWSTSSTSQQITAASAGYYTVTITDNNGCTNTSVPTLVSFHPTANIVSNGPTTFCFGQNVNLTATPTGTYLWSNGSTAASINNITSPGTYTVSVTDVNGCSSVSDPVSINVNPLPNGSISAGGSTTICQGSSVTLNTNGDAHTKYYWYVNGSLWTYAVYDPFSSTYINYPVTGYSLAVDFAATFSAQIIDTLTGCSQMTNGIAVNVIPLPQVSITQTSAVLCNGGNTAALTATAMGTVSPYTYSWSTNATTASVSSLTAGNYTVTVTDNAGCMNHTSALISQPTPVAPSLSSPVNTRGFNTSCHGVADGSITVSAGGTPGYTYAWSTNATTSSLQNVGIGNYTVTVTDANGCTGVGSILLIEPPAVTLSLTSAIYIGGNEIRCHGERGAITAHTGGGTGPFTYLWSDTQTTQTADTLFAGTYSVVAADSEGCSITKSFTLHQPAALLNPLTAVDHNGYNISCHGFTDGVITTNVSGGIMGYQYWWNDSITTANRNNLHVGKYTVLVTDTNGCQRLDSIRLTEPTQIVTQTIGSTLNCYGDANGTASVLASGGDPGYTYHWSNGNTNAALTNLTAALYSITVTDSRGCTKQDTTSVLQPPKLVAHAFGTYIGCGTQIGLLSGSAEGGVAPYGYLWSNGIAIDYQVNLPVGNYSLTVTDSHGCMDTAATIILNPPVLVSSFSVVTNANNSILSVNVSGGVTPYMYLWSDGKNTTSDTIPNTHPSGVYSVIVTDANGCTSTGSQFIIGTGCTLHSLLHATDVSCNSGTNGIITSIVAGNVGPVNYLWSAGSQTTSSISGLIAGKYYLQITDSVGCAYNDSALVNEPAALVVTATPASAIACHGGSASITVTAMGGSLPYASGIGTFTQSAGTVSYAVTDHNGCISSSPVTLYDPALLTASVSSNTNSICSGDDVTLTFTGPANGNVTYQINSGAATVINLDGTGNASLTLNALTATTTINLVHVDSLICGNLVSQLITVNVTQKSPWYLDTDHDGYYNGTVVMACVSPGINYANTVLTGDIDCDDANPNVHPFALEICNHIDDNCNGLIDENGSNIYYADADGDGFGNPFNSVIGCFMPSGYVTNNQDCNDAVTAINPNATEICGNNIDDNCNGLVDEGCAVLCTNPPTASAGNDVTICAGDNVPLNGGIGGGATNATWTTSGSGSFTPSGNILNAIYIPSAADKIAGDVKLILTTDAALGCTPATDTMVVHITPLPVTPLVITGPTALCYPTPNAPFTYSVAPVAGAVSYNWTVPANTTIISGQGTTTLVVNWTFIAIHNGVSGPITVSAVNSIGCSSILPAILNISVQLQVPVTPPSISGAQKVCPGDINIYSVAAVARADQYNWTVPAGMTIINGANSNIISVQTDGSFVGGNISVTASNGCGASPARLQPVSRNVLPASTAIAGPVNGVCNMNGVVYTATPVTGAGAYTWTVPAGATINGAANGSSIVVDFGTITSGNITVAAINNCGAGLTRSITVAGKPGIASVINGPLTLCSGTNYIYDVPTVSGASTYTWLVPTRMTILSGQGSKTITVKAGATGGSMTVNVTASNACGSGAVKVLSGVSIVSCPRLDDGIHATNVYAYPNPVHDVLHIQFESDKNHDYVIRLLSAMGQIVRVQSGNATEGENKVDLPTNDLSAGIYMIEVQTGDQKDQTRIIVE